MSVETKNTDLSSKTKILVVDDNAQYLEMLNDVLINKGYDVRYADNGKAGLGLYSEYLPDIVITDIVMPEVDGIELLVNLQKINPKVRVIVMSGGNSGFGEDYLQMAETLGADVILTKPFQTIELVNEIKKIESNINRIN